MAAQSASLTINVIANAAKARAGFKEAEKGALSLKGQFDTLKSQMLGKAGLAIGFTAVAGFAMKAAGEFTALAKSAGDLSTATGLTTEQASRWIAVADDAQVGADGLATAFKNINKDLDNSKWSKYGIQTKDAAGKARAANDVFLDILDTLYKIKDPTERARAGTELLGKAWGGLAPLVGKSRDEYKRMLASVEAGQVITQNEYDKAEKLRLAQDQLADSWKELSLAVGEGVANMTPALKLLAESLGLVAKGFALVLNADAASTASELDNALAGLTTNAGDVWGMAGAFDGLATATFNGRSSWDKAVNGMDLLTGGITTLGKSETDLQRMRAAQDAFNQILKASPKDALATAMALKELNAAAADPNAPQGLKDQATQWGLNGETIDGWIDQAQGAITEEDNLNARIKEQNDLLDGLTGAWEDYLGLLDIQGQADDAKTALLELTYAIDDPTTATNEFRDAQKAAAEEVAGFIKQAKDIPQDIQLKMLADLQSGDLAAVYNEIDAYTKAHPPTIPVDVQLNSTNFKQWIQSLGGIGGSVFSGAYGWGGQKRAAGGPVSTAGTYLVGEMGPELFTPSTGGSVIPSGAFGAAGGGGVQNITINMPAGANGPELLRALQAEARRTGQLALPVSSKTIR